jgi:hypothetical protein
MTPSRFLGKPVAAVWIVSNAQHNSALAFLGVSDVARARTEKRARMNRMGRTTKVSSCDLIIKVRTELAQGTTLQGVLSCNTHGRRDWIQ